MRENSRCLSDLWYERNTADAASSRPFGRTKVRIAPVRPWRCRSPERERDGVHVDLRGALQTDADLQILLLQLHAGESDKAVVHRDDDVLLARDVGELGIEPG